MDPDGPVAASMVRNHAITEQEMRRLGEQILGGPGLRTIAMW